MARKKTVNHRNSNKSSNKQYYNPKTKHYVERNPKTGKFVDNKTSSRSKFKKVGKKKSK